MIRHRSSAFRPLSASARMSVERRDGVGRSDTVFNGFHDKYRRHLDTVTRGTSTSLYAVVNSMASDEN